MEEPHLAPWQPPWDGSLQQAALRPSWGPQWQRWRQLLHRPASDRRPLGQIPDHLPSLGPSASTLLRRVGNLCCMYRSARAGRPCAWALRVGLPRRVGSDKARVLPASSFECKWGGSGVRSLPAMLYSLVHRPCLPCILRIFPRPGQGRPQFPLCLPRPWAPNRITQCHVQLLVNMGQGKHLFLRKGREVAKGRGDLRTLPHVLASVQPSNEVTGQLHTLSLPIGSQAAGRSQIHCLSNQCRQQRPVTEDGEGQPDSGDQDSTPCVPGRDPLLSESCDLPL